MKFASKPYLAICSALVAVYASAFSAFASDDVAEPCSVTFHSHYSGRKNDKLVNVLLEKGYTFANAGEPTRFEIFVESDPSLYDVLNEVKVFKASELVFTKAERSIVVDSPFAFGYVKKLLKTIPACQ